MITSPLLGSRRRLGQGTVVEVVSTSREWQIPIKAACEAFVASNLSKEAITAEMDAARKNATELRKASRRESSADTAIRFFDAANEADFYAECLRKKLAVLFPPPRVEVPPPPPPPPIGPPVPSVDTRPRPVVYDEYGMPVDGSGSKLKFPIFPETPHGPAPRTPQPPKVPASDNAPRQNSEFLPTPCPDRIEAWKSWYATQMGSASMKTVLYGTKRNGIRLGAPEGMLTVIVRDTEGNPVDGAIVTLEKADVIAQGVTEGGMVEFALTQSQIGSATLSFRAPSGYQPYTDDEISIKIVAGENSVEFVAEKTNSFGLLVTLLGLAAGAGVAAAL